MYAPRYEPIGLRLRVNNGRNRFSGGDRPLPHRTERIDWRPAVDVIELPDRFVIDADVPGVEPKDIEVTMDDGVLSIRGNRLGQGETGPGVLRTAQRRSGSFSRSFSLPESADGHAVTARSSHGVLRVEIAKKAADKPRRISVS